MLRALAIGLGLLLTPTAASAQDWPQRPVRLVVPYSAGGGTDSVARMLAQKLGDAFGQRFIVENKPGASGMIGAQTVAKGDADGYTFLVASPAEIALNQNLFKDMTYDPLKDLTPVTLLAWTPLVLAAHPTFAASNPAELVKLARAQPVDFSSPGTGSSHHLTGEYINKLQSTQLLHVPYRGAAPAVSDAVGGQVKLTVSGMPPVVQFLQAGKLKAIAVTSKRRSPTFPNIPAMAETTGFEDIDFTNWFGLLARTGTPQPIVDKLERAAVAALKDPQVRDLLITQAAEPVGNTAAEFRDFIRAESARYAKIVELTGVKVK
jgi:tripartite-type tricarboxylate transporter receptor subunit TctC